MALMDGARTTTTTLRRDALGRVNTPRAQREVILDEFESSGLSAACFARAAGIKYQTFANWVQQRRHAGGDYERQQRIQPAAIRLVEVVAQVAPVTADVSADLSGMDTSALEVLLPGGAHLLVHDAGQAELAAQLLRHLQNSAAAPLPC
jgi:transposase-like protein